MTPYAWAAHAAMGVAIQGACALALIFARIRNAWWIGAALSIGYWWSREKTEFEFHLKSMAHATSLGAYWYRGFIPLEWDVASQVQFYAPAITNILLALLLSSRGRDLPIRRMRRQTRLADSPPRRQP